MQSKSRFPEGAHEAAALFVRNAVREQRWVAGQVLDVKDLAEELGMSASPVREALARLRGEGVLDSRYRDGFSIPIFQPHELAGEYRYIGLLTHALSSQTLVPQPKFIGPDRPYIVRLEEFLISLARAADLLPVAKALCQSSLRLTAYTSAEIRILRESEADLSNMERLLANAERTALRRSLARFYRQRRSAAAEICRAVFEESKRFGKAFE